jgi:hypothetical protein
MTNTPEIPTVKIKSEYFGYEVINSDFENVIIKQGDNRIEVDGPALIKAIQACRLADMLLCDGEVL